MNLKKLIAVFAGLMLAFAIASAQNGASISVVLTDASTDEPVGFATVSITKKGDTKPYKYALSTSEGKTTISGIAKGEYEFKAELLGYKAYVKEIKIEDKKPIDLGTVKMDVDQEVLDAASVQAAGNQIVVKKDTIEYNATSFKTTDNDMLEDLLKKLPGVEVSEDGSITANGETITKITIDGKTFFLDDPQLASKNLPAKIINKVKVVQKKSEQAEFSGIDDGNEETVIDLSVHKGMMNGVFGNISLGGGHDIPQTFPTEKGDWRYQGGAFVGKFTEKSQLSLILNGNNTNNRGYNDISGGMMQGMRGGGGGMGRGQGGNGGENGITESWMGGVNGAWTLFDDKMNLSGDYLYNNTSKYVEEESIKTTYLDDGSNLIYKNGVSGPGYNTTNSDGHRFGLRLEHKFSENTTILFQPQVNFGSGNYREYSDFETLKELNGTSTKTNEGFTDSRGDNNNWQTNGFFLFRQRLGIPGRTLTFMTNYNFSGNSLDGFNQSLTDNFGASPSKDIVNQRIDSDSKSSSLSGRLVYTEPLGSGFYVSANYSYSWSKNTSTKNTYDSADNSIFSFDNHQYVVGTTATGLETLNTTYSSDIINQYNNQDAGVDFQYQKDKLHAQIGMSVKPTKTHNETNGKTYDDNVVNWAPSAMLWYDINDNTNARLFYRGNSSQPSTSQLMPIPDNTNPMSVALGNPYLTPYFSHNLNSEFRMTNKKSFLSINANIQGGFVQDPIVSAIWYGTNGAQYSLPVNGPSSGNISGRFFINGPIAKSNFTIFSMTNGSYSHSSSYVGKSSFDMSKYANSDGVFEDYDLFHTDFPDLGESDLFTENKTQTVNFTEAMRLTYRNSFVEIVAGGRTRMNKSWYTLNTATNLTTWNHSVSGDMTWTIPGGLEVRTQARYNWYRGYTTPQEDEVVLNAEINKLLFKNKFTLALRGYDLLNQAKNLTVTDASNYHMESRNNTLGRYVIVSLTYRFGTFGGNKSGGQRSGMGGGRPMGPPPGGM